MSAPVVSIVSVSRSKISHQSSVNQSSITFSFDVPVQAYSVNILGTAPTTGTVAGAQSKYVSDLSNKTVSTAQSMTVQSVRQWDAGTQFVEIVDDQEVGATANDGDYRINLYGESIDGTWTPYNQA